jgi:hypothetical protein
LVSATASVLSGIVQSNNNGMPKGAIAIDALSNMTAAEK